VNQTGSAPRINRGHGPVLFIFEFPFSLFSLSSLQKCSPLSLASTAGDDLLLRWGSGGWPAKGGGATGRNPKAYIFYFFRCFSSILSPLLNSHPKIIQKRANNPRSRNEQKRKLTLLSCRELVRLGTCGWGDRFGLAVIGVVCVCGLLFVCVWCCCVVVRMCVVNGVAVVF